MVNQEPEVDYTFEDFKSGKVRSDIKKLSGTPAHLKGRTEVSDMKPSDSNQDKGHSKSSSNGSGSQDSIDSLRKILWYNFQDACDSDTVADAIKEITAWHNTQLKAEWDERVNKNGSLCGCPMCTFHTEVSDMLVTGRKPPGNDANAPRDGGART